MHPVVAGELACGDLRNRREILGLLDALPQAVAATHAEVREFIETHRLMGKGLGFVDARLLAATALGGDARLWTRDKRLREASMQLGLAFSRPA